MITGNNIEQRALACFTFARCIIAAADSIRKCACLHFIDLVLNNFGKLMACAKPSTT